MILLTLLLIAIFVLGFCWMFISWILPYAIAILVVSAILSIPLSKA
jgi:hypothetical protein